MAHAIVATILNGWDLLVRQHVQQELMQIPLLINAFSVIIHVTHAQELDQLLALSVLLDILKVDPYV